MTMRNGKLKDSSKKSEWGRCTSSLILLCWTSANFLALLPLALLDHKLQFCCDYVICDIEYADAGERQGIPALEVPLPVHVVIGPLLRSHSFFVGLPHSLQEAQCRVCSDGVIFLIAWRSPMVKVKKIKGRCVHTSTLICMKNDIPRLKGLDIKMIHTWFLKLSQIVHDLVLCIFESLDWIYLLEWKGEKTDQTHSTLPVRSLPERGAVCGHVQGTVDIAPNSSLWNAVMKDTVDVNALYDIHSNMNVTGIKQPVEINEEN